MRLRTFHAEGSSTLLISGGVHIPKTSVQEAISAFMNNTVYIVIQNTLLCRKPYKDKKRKWFKFSDLQKLFRNKIQKVSILI